ncbi:response regulator transcription factor [Rhizobium sp. ARZ01]|uniref:helix-turn-helix domain-containing protein n=1 Tax=Rhizobium sp. ARZ01 TaxID=2769313 RepID=UPI001FEEC0E5|nr:response regulator transcription factor [Rhizobium sp. ARZ01]
MDGNDYAEAGVGAVGVRGGPEPQRVMLILTNTGSVSNRLIDAVEREFPWVVVEQLEQVNAACRTFSHPVALILVDIALMREAEAASAILTRVHPNALTAVIEPNDKLQTTSLSAVVDSPLVRSVLPMDLRLDVWLSIVRLMLCGGEYLPPGSIIHTRTGDPGLPILGHYGSRQLHRKTEGNRAELTARELQILEMVSRGLQNKLIAAAFGLSENTVKIHLHNIIRKLGVHNRTEAAARFRNTQYGGARID